MRRSTVLSLPLELVFLYIVSSFELIILKQFLYCHLDTNQYFDDASKYHIERGIKLPC
jgi:hypothetical protein